MSHSERNGQPETACYSGGEQAARNLPPIEKRWKPGQSGNPRGRPKRPSLTEALIAKLAELSPGKDQQTGFDAVVDAVAEQLIKASPWAVEQFWNRLEGKPNSIPVEDAREFARSLFDAVKRHVTDEHTLRAIAADMASIYAPSSAAL